MAVNRSPLQRVSDNVFSRIESLRNQQIDPQVPFGFERVDKTAAKKKLADMTPAGRKRFIDKMGLENVFKIIGE